MNLGNNLYQARKRVSLSQETVAEKLGVSRQTISKWETDETIPDIYQSKKLATLYKLSLDELIEFDVNLKEVEEIIKNTNEEKEAKINWTKAWSKKYPVLAKYQEKVEISQYSNEIRKMLDSLNYEYGYPKLESMLILKDILYHEWKDTK